MLIVSRTVDYSELLDMLRGKKVAIWTCNTCARLCNNIGGTESSERLAEELRKDGVEVTGVVSTSAACRENNVVDKKAEILAGNPDVILSMTCCAGDANAKKVFGRDTINPIVTHGFGILTDDGTPVLMDGTSVDSLSDRSSPFI